MMSSAGKKLARSNVLFYYLIILSGIHTQLLAIPLGLQYNDGKVGL